MGAAKPVADYPSRSAAACAWLDDGMTVAEIAARLGVSYQAAAALLAYRPAGPSLKIPLAARRIAELEELARAAGQSVGRYAAALIEAVLDGDPPGSARSAPGGQASVLRQAQVSGLTAHHQESRAKASEDNGSYQATDGHAASGDASRLSAGRTADGDGGQLPSPRSRAGAARTPSARAKPSDCKAVLDALRRCAARISSDAFEIPAENIARLAEVPAEKIADAMAKLAASRRIEAVAVGAGRWRVGLKRGIAA